MIKDLSILERKVMNENMVFAIISFSFNQFTIFEYLKNIILEAPEELKPSKYVHQCNDNPFKIKEESNLLDPKSESRFISQISSKVVVRE